MQEQDPNKDLKFDLDRKLILSTNLVQKIFNSNIEIPMHKGVKILNRMKDEEQRKKKAQMEENQGQQHADRIQPEEQEQVKQNQKDTIILIGKDQKLSSNNLLNKIGSWLLGSSLTINRASGYPIQSLKNIKQYKIWTSGQNDEIQEMSIYDSGKFRVVVIDLKVEKSYAYFAYFLNTILKMCKKSKVRVCAAINSNNQNDDENREKISKLTNISQKQLHYILVQPQQQNEQKQNNAAVLNKGTNKSPQLSKIFSESKIPWKENASKIIKQLINYKTQNKRVVGQLQEIQEKLTNNLIKFVKPIQQIYDIVFNGQYQYNEQTGRLFKREIDVIKNFYLQPTPESNSEKQLKQYIAARVQIIEPQYYLWTSKMLAYNQYISNSLRSKQQCNRKILNFCVQNNKNPTKILVCLELVLSHIKQLNMLQLQINLQINERTQNLKYLQFYILSVFQVITNIWELSPSMLDIDYYSLNDTIMLHDMKSDTASVNKLKQRIAERICQRIEIGMNLNYYRVHQKLLHECFQGLDSSEMENWDKVYQSRKNSLQLLPLFKTWAILNNNTSTDEILETIKYFFSKYFEQGSTINLNSDLVLSIFNGVGKIFINFKLPELAIQVFKKIKVYNKIDQCLKMIFIKSSQQQIKNECIRTAQYYFKQSQIQKALKYYQLAYQIFPSLQNQLAYIGCKKHLISSSLPPAPASKPGSASKIAAYNTFDSKLQSFNERVKQINKNQFIMIQKLEQDQTGESFKDYYSYQFGDDFINKILNLQAVLQQNGFFNSENNEHGHLLNISVTVEELSKLEMLSEVFTNDE